MPSNSKFNPKREPVEADGEDGLEEARMELLEGIEEHTRRIADALERPPPEREPAGPPPAVHVAPQIHVPPGKPCAYRLTPHRGANGLVEYYDLDPK